ncbi:MAG: pyruvate kinase, partial [Pseudomonadota bacterium]
VVAFTSSGSTALWMSRLNCGIPIFALTQEPATYTKMSLYRETFPLLMKEMHHDRDVMRYDAEQSLIEAGVVKKGDLIVLCYGDKRGHTGGTNTMTIVRVGEQRPPSA